MIALSRAVLPVHFFQTCAVNAATTVAALYIPHYRRVYRRIVSITAVLPWLRSNTTILVPIQVFISQQWMIKSQRWIAWHLANS